MARTKRLALHSMVAALGLSYFGAAETAEAADSRNYNIGQTVNVHINWDTFVDEGFTEFTYEEFRDAFINGYTRWQHVAGANIKVKWIGQTTRDPDADDFVSDEIFVRANQSHVVGTRLASTFGCGDSGAARCTQIVVHREKADGTKNVFNLWDGGAAGADIQAVLTHEIGHALGLDHATTDGNTMWGNYRFNQRFGPYVDDRNRLIALYGEEEDVKVKLWRSTSHGDAYASFASLPTSLHTTGDIDGTRDSSTLLFTYTKQTKHPCWIIGNINGTFDTSKWWCVGGQTGFYGTAVDGEGDEYMIAWAEPSADGLNANVKVSYGTKAQFEAGGLSGRSPSGAVTYGTPGIAKLGANTWVLAYSKFDRSDDTVTGQVVARVTTDDGSTWSNEILLNDFYRAESGVSVAGQQGTGIRVGFSYAADENNVRGNYTHRTFRASISGSSLTYQGVMASSSHTRTFPVLSRSSSHYQEAHRGTDAATSLTHARATVAATSWTDQLISMSGTDNMPTSPGLAADKDGSNVYLFTSF